MIRVDECCNDSRLRQSQPQADILRSGFQQQGNFITSFESLLNEAVGHLIGVEFQLAECPALVLVVKDDFVRMTANIFTKDGHHIAIRSFEAIDKDARPDQAN